MRYWPEFVEFYFPAAHAAIDWAAPYEFLDQELEELVRDASFGRRRVDKLVRVSSKTGAVGIVYVHIELQSRHDRSFAERVWVYHYRLFERFRTPVASLAILSDGSRHWRPSSYGYERFGCRLSLEFPTVKLADYHDRLDWLCQHDNVFGLITAAHVLTQRTRGKTARRLAHKRELAANVFGRNWDRQRILDLMRLIDWLMRLPRDLERELRHEIHTKLDRRRIMLPLTSLDRVERKRGRQEGLQEGLQRGLQEGMQQGMEQGMQQGRLLGMRQLIEGQLERRFGTLEANVRNRLASLNEDDLQRLIDRMVTGSANSADELVDGR